MICAPPPSPMSLPQIHFFIFLRKEGPFDFDSIQPQNPLAFLVLIQQYSCRLSFVSNLQLGLQSSFVSLLPHSSHCLGDLNVTMNGCSTQWPLGDSNHSPPLLIFSSISATLTSHLALLSTCIKLLN